MVMSKDGIRQRIFSARDGLSQEEHQRRSAIIVEKLKAEPLIDKAQVILAYQPFRSEVDISAFNDWAFAQGKTLAFPISLPDRCLIPAVPANGPMLEQGKFGIKAPDMETSRILSPQEIDCLVIPCVGFSRDAYRLGMGGGFYDCFLPTCPQATKIGVAFSLQFVEEPFTDPWDMPLDRIITD